MTPSHLGRAKKRLDCAARPTRFALWIDPKRLSAPATRPAAKLGEPWAREGNGSGRVFRRTVRLLGDEMLHRFGAGRDRSATRLRALTKRCVLPRGAYQEVRLTQRWAKPRRGPLFAASQLRSLAAYGEGGAARHNRRLGGPCRLEAAPAGSEFWRGKNLVSKNLVSKNLVSWLEEARRPKPSQRRVAAGES